MCSISSPTNIFPCSQACALRGSVFGRWPSPKMDFIRLNTNSICQRRRYRSRIWLEVTVFATVVQTIKYSANSRAWSVTVDWLSRARRCKRLCAQRVASTLCLKTISRPAIQSPFVFLTQAVYSCGVFPLSFRKRGSKSMRVPFRLYKGKAPRLNRTITSPPALTTCNTTPVMRRPDLPSRCRQPPPERVERSHPLGQFR